MESFEGFRKSGKVSLINCITISGPGSGTRGTEHYHFSSVFPHFAIFGDEHITSEDRKIAEVSFLVDDAATLFHDFDAYGEVIDARPHMERIAAEKRYGRTIELGPHPLIFYFTGKHEIFRTSARSPEARRRAFRTRRRVGRRRR